MFYQVTSSITDAPLRDYHFHGYEDQDDFARAIRRIIRRWHDRVGEAIDHRNGFILLRFHDTPGGKPDEEWLPRYLLHPADKDYHIPKCTTDPVEAELDAAFGFD